MCQDSAHFGLACVRSIGLAGRYMSGYVETFPTTGKPKLVGLIFLPTHGSTSTFLKSDG
ncbi:MAG: hypothetical protein U5K79_15375 [Cyclobacteriaceae bacterium]|nr:hypothetical protein [Cyclobacteriaceae bacterium]